MKKHITPYFKRYSSSTSGELGFIAIVCFVVLCLVASVASSEDKYLDSKTKRRLNESISVNKNKWHRAIKDLQKQTSKGMSHLEDEFEDLKDQTTHQVQKYKKDIEEVKAKTMKILSSPTVQEHANIEGIDLNVTSTNATEVQTYIFVSTSMNKQNLIDLGKQAKKEGASLVMRGLLENSYLKTASYFTEIVEKSGAGVSIDPELFKTYQIQEVPTFVIAKGNKHDKLSGNVTLRYAISEFKKKGEVFQSKEENENN